jgi:glycine betaine/choline ABC-type transport system substrate-binding protein
MRKLTRLFCPFFLVLIMLPFIGCSRRTEIVRIAAKDFTEQYILGEILSALVNEYTDLGVELTTGIAGGTSNIHPAMVKGEFDMYPEYTGTAWMTVLKKKELPDNETLYTQLVEEYKKNYNFVWTGLYGFNNAYGLAVLKETSDKYNLKTYTDLAKYSPELIFGAGYEFFEREDGFDGLQKIYGLNFKGTLEMNLSLKYNALEEKEVDVITIYKTDGQMSNTVLVELEDNLTYFPAHMCGTVVRGEVLEKHPELEKVLEKLNGMISNEEMAVMNAAVDLEGRNEKEVALEFLRQKGLIQ